jgi:hypothetical protein
VGTRPPKLRKPNIIFNCQRLAVVLLIVSAAIITQLHDPHVGEQAGPRVQ